MLVTKALRSRRGALSLCTPPETEISCIIHYFKSHEPGVHATFFYPFLSFKKASEKVFETLNPMLDFNISIFIT